MLSLDRHDGSAVRRDREAVGPHHRCGHKSFSTTMLYVREGEAIRAGFGDPFPPLPDVLLGIAPGDIFFTNQPKTSTSSGVDGTRTRGLRRDRPAL